MNWTNLFIDDSDEESTKPVTITAESPVMNSQGINEAKKTNNSQKLGTNSAKTIKKMNKKNKQSRVSNKREEKKSVVSEELIPNKAYKPQEKVQKGKKVENLKKKKISKNSSNAEDSWSNNSSTKSAKEIMEWFKGKLIIHPVCHCCFTNIFD